MAVLERLHTAGLTTKLSKCQWAKQSLIYMNHRVENGLVSLPQVKVKALQNYIKPKLS